MDAIAPACAVHRLVPVVDNIPIARDTFRLRLGDPAIADTIEPGQFVMIRPGPEGATDPLLGRPLALYDVVRDRAGRATAFDVVYLVVGRGTAALPSASQVSGSPSGAPSAMVLAHAPPDLSCWSPGESGKLRSWLSGELGWARPVTMMSLRVTVMMF